MSVNIREETPADLRRIEAVTVSAFLNAPHTVATGSVALVVPKAAIAERRLQSRTP